MIVSRVSHENNGGGILWIVAAEVIVAVTMCVVIIVAMSMAMAMAVTVGVVVQRMK